MRTGSVLLIAVAALAVTGCAPRIGVVDSKRILNESVLALSYQKQLDDREKAMLTDLQLLSGQLSREDLEARRQTHVRELTAFRRDLEGRLNDRIREAVAEVARRRRLQFVIKKEAAKLGGVDITDQVIERLK